MTADNLREDIKNRVKEAADIVQVIGEVVELKKAGAHYSGLCPFHAEKTPSFSVNAQGQFFHCFGCGESGDVFSFVMKYGRLSFPEALQELAKRYHIDLPQPKLSEADRERIRQRELLFRVNDEAARIYQDFMAIAPEAENARNYLAGRGVSAEVMQQFMLGYAPAPETAGWGFLLTKLQGKKLHPAAIEKAGLAVKKDSGGYYDRFRDRVLFPIKDVSGQVVAFGGRILGDGKPKYLNSPESPIFDKSRVLFGLFQHKEEIRQCRQAIVVEGNFDLVLLAEHGIKNVVAPLGTALTKEQIRLLRGYCDEVVLLFDGDSAGLKAAMRAVPFFLIEKVDARVAVLPDGHDPDSYVRENGADSVEKLVGNAKPLAEFVFETMSRQYGMTLDGKNKIVSELREIVAAGGDSVQSSLMVSHFSELLGITVEQFQKGVSQAKVRKPPEKKVVQASLKNLSRKERQLLDFVILYPEYFPELLDADIEEVIVHSGILSIFQVLKELAADGNLTPDRILVGLAEGTQERSYVAGLLIQGDRAGGDDEDDDGLHARNMCDELLRWLDRERHRQDGVTLQEQIRQAQVGGDHAKLMELLVKKQKNAKKL